MAITDWPDDERPRERLLSRGAAALSDAELLAIFLRVGVKGMSAVDLARRLLAHFDNSLARLAAATPQELLTRNLKESLKLVDVRVVDHFIVAGTAPPLSFAERGLL